MKKMDKGKVQIGKTPQEKKKDTQKSGATKTQAGSVRKAKRTAESESQRKERLRLRPGIRTIDVSAVRRMISWSIGECERQLDNLRSAIDVIDGLTAKDAKKK